MGDLCELFEQSTAVECLVGAECAARCGERCVVREEYKSKLLEIQAELPSIRALLENERARLAQEKRFLDVARSWAEYSQQFSWDSPSTHTKDTRSGLSEESDRRR
jgi:hypothetical protein